MQFTVVIQKPGSLDTDFPYKIHHYNKISIIKFHATFSTVNEKYHLPESITICLHTTITFLHILNYFAYCFSQFSHTFLFLISCFNIYLVLCGNTTILEAAETNERLL